VDFVVSQLKKKRRGRKKKMVRWPKKSEGGRSMGKFEEGEKAKASHIDNLTTSKN